MKGAWLWLIISANLLALVALVFVYPDLMVSPGRLAPGHAALATDCFACHAPLRGATADRCITCHAVRDIGLRSTTGIAMPPARHLKASFHQALSQQNCVACHSDHAGPKLTQGDGKPFAHDLLRVATRERCESCHAAPDNGLHRNQGLGCAKCHRTEAWAPASFAHSALSSADLSHCERCHKAPSDGLHQRITGHCAQCHSPAAWKPANFDHDKFFPLDADHDASCATCHPGNDYRRYTCYGCHEHTPANIRARHEEEVGGENLDHCVRCHRSPRGDD